jgi:ceramide glucosyltransferase
VETAAIILLLLALAGCVYTVAAAVLVGRYRRAAPRDGATAPDVAILKPLHGDEPALAANLASFLDQDYRGGVALICGIADPGDPAAAVVAGLAAAPTTAAVSLVVDATRHGTNAKVSNLINLAVRASAPVVIVSDSDIAVAPDYLRRVIAALSAEGVGAVTCLYRGRGDAGGWSVLAAAGISYQFMPAVAVGIATGRAHPCMGSTIALSAETLARIGGFASVADQLADDHALGAAVRATGLAVVVPPMLVVHGCAETGLAGLLRHEIRWNATIRSLDPLGYVGSMVTHPMPLALIGMALAGGAGWQVLIFALVARLCLKWRVDMVAGASSAPLWMLPPRDILSFMAFLAGLFARSIDWRGAKLRMVRDGRLAAGTE